jgi:hypothetical protein
LCDVTAAIPTRFPVFSSVVSFTKMEPNNAAPDSWDQDVDMAKGMQGLNVNAAVFVPGQNVFAKEFVPNFGGSNADTPNANGERRVGRGVTFIASNVHYFNFPRDCGKPVDRCV